MLTVCERLHPGTNSSATPTTYHRRDSALSAVGTFDLMRVVRRAAAMSIRLGHERDDDTTRNLPPSPPSV